MPELAEVEVVRQDLEKILSHQPKLLKVELMRADLREPMPAAEIQKFVGLKIERVERRAKYLLLWTEKGALLSHLGMTGTWREAPPEDRRLHDHIYLHFEGGLRLAFRDPRRFGVFGVVYDVRTHKSLRHLGPEPLSGEFTGESLWRSLRGKSIALKAAVMDQKIVVGVGNIYANEALFAAKIKPQKKSSALTREQAKALVSQIKKILKKAIREGGSSISDFAHASGDSGKFQNSFQVYDRAGEKCRVCKAPIKSAVLGGRSTYWCPRCQK